MLTFNLILIFILIWSWKSNILKSYIVSNTINRIKSAGFPVQEHFTHTTDGYIIALHRIPSKLKKQDILKVPAIYLQHGFGTSSSDWILSGPEKGLAYILSNEGYDVWLGNARGNFYCRNHTSLKINSSDFWKFSWHEIGMYDVAANIDYILYRTKTKCIHYIGHSQGTTSFFVLMTMRPEYNKKICTMHAFAPAVYLKNIQSPFVKILGPIFGTRNNILKLSENSELNPVNEAYKAVQSYFCHKNSPLQDICRNMIFNLVGDDDDNLNLTMIPDILGNTPAGASINQVIHYAQIYMAKKFQLYDHGLYENRKIYGKTIPPIYDLKKVTAPIYIYYGVNDWLCPAEDILEFANDLKSVRFIYKVPHLKWNHLDFVYGIKAKKLLYDIVIKKLSTFNKKMWN